VQDDPFTTVAIAHTPPQALVILSLLQWHGIPAYAMNLETVRVNPPITLALGGIPIRVDRDAADEARTLLIEAEQQPDESRRATVLERAGTVVVALVTGATPPPKLAATLLD
jgi:hypothetical protein